MLIISSLALKLKSNRLLSIEFAIMIVQIDLNFEFAILEFAAGKSYNTKRKIKKERLVLRGYFIAEEESLCLWLKDNKSLFLKGDSFENKKRNLMFDVDEGGLYRSVSRLSN